MENVITSKEEFYSQEFANISLSRKELTGKEFDCCVFNSCDFSEAIVRNCKFSNCKFVNCSLSLLSTINSKFLEVEFQECKMLGIDWTKAYWRGLVLGSQLQFKKCLINSSSFYGLNQAGITIEACQAHDVDFREANFNLATNYDININNNIIRTAKFCRYEAVRLLESLGIDLIS
ncbi:pentapeptide repeat-containing protein [Isorropodon fossajaponicum endosymbiont JTNG4]|uniref:pentapeptide repeat-containing protein n=1 Tax=Isorropodon fossajaponicum symbiont TaxID=883811 RepID=UPI00191568E3|nr:pentapeptide repeat-containing protein [Isorropodon fossajaponicum symbiont]BBB23649.1 pentapeptide repeat-containing protein [Isorropodon fossajaponicum endosymbiont JTNG4]